MKVEDVMTAAVHTCSRDWTLDQVVRVMWEQDLGALVVVNDHGQPIGMVTDRDACMAGYTQGKVLPEIPVHRAMSNGIFTCHRDDRIGSAERTMRTHQVRRLPVVDAAMRLVGIVTLNDIALARVRSPYTKAAERLIGDVAITLAAIARPRCAAQPAPAEPASEWNPFEVQNSQAFRERSAEPEAMRIPPPGLRNALSLFRT